MHAMPALDPARRDRAVWPGIAPSLPPASTANWPRA